jgi:aryl-alcohol dehydrogenase-like predicted oxidoreductase
VIPLCAANGISQIVWSPLGQGVLSGKYDPDSRRRGIRAPPARRWAASWTG